VTDLGGLMLDGSFWWAVLGAVLVIESVGPLLSPQRWRATLTKLLAWRDGQLRFMALLGMVGGCVLLATAL
jgi:uncharacterized protein